MTLRYPDLESVKKEIETEITAYIHAITTLGSLREHLRNINIRCYVEKKLEKKIGGHKSPDLLIRSGNYLIVDHKYTESADSRTLASKVEEMKEYETTFILSSFESEARIEFEPEIVMLTPQKATTHFRKILNCPTTWGYRLNEEIIIEQSVGSVKDSKVLSLFDPTLFCPKAEEISKYKFVISRAPLPYTAYQVYTVLWTLWTPTRYFTPEFEVKYDDVLDVFNNLFPPWISGEIKQLNASRLQEAILCLQEIGWIRWLETEKKVIVYRSKGRYVPDLFSYLIDHCVKSQHARRVKEYEKKAKKLRVEEPLEQKKISDFFSLPK